MTQVNTRKVTVSSIVGSAAFQQGVADYLAGKPFNYDGIAAKWDWHYERGRMFAAVLKAKGEGVPASRRGRYVSPHAIATYSKNRGKDGIL